MYRFFRNLLLTSAIFAPTTAFANCTVTVSCEEIIIVTVPIVRCTQTLSCDL